MQHKLEEIHLQNYWEETRPKSNSPEIPVASYLLEDYPCVKKKYSFIINSKI